MIVVLLLIIYPNPVIRLQFLLVFVWSRLQWFCVEGIFINHKNTISQQAGKRLLIRSKRSSLFPETECLSNPNGVVIPSQRSAYPISKKSIPFFEKVYTLFPKTL